MAKPSLFARKSNAPVIPPGGGGGGATFDPHFGWYAAPAYNNSNDPPTIVNRNGTGSPLGFFTAVNGSYNFRGTQIKYEWLHLEVSFNSYDFDQLKLDLAAHGPGKRCFITIAHRSSGGSVTNPPKHAVPAYMRTTDYGGGEKQYNQNGGNNWASGYLTAFWNTEVRNRFDALIAAMAAELTTAGLMDKVEGVGLTESAVGQPLSGQSAPNEVQYYEGWAAAMQSCRTHMPGKIHFVFMNFEADTMNTVISQLPTLKCALGTPDTFVDKPDLINTGRPGIPGAGGWQGIYQYYIQQLNNIPLIGSIQPQNFQGNRPPFPTAPGGIPDRLPSFNELVTFNKTTIRPNYLIITYTNADYSAAGYAGITYTHPANGYSFWQNDVLPYMLQSAQQSTPHGGLNNTIPAVLLTP